MTDATDAAPGGSRRAMEIGIVVGVVLTFTLDAQLELGAAIGMLYLPWVVAALATRSVRFVVGVAVVCAALTLVDVLVSPPAAEGVGDDLVATNRALTVLSILVVGALCVALLRGVERMQRTNDELARSRAELQANYDVWDSVSRVTRTGAWSIDLDLNKVSHSREITRIYGADFTDQSMESALEWYAPEFRQRVRHVFERCSTTGEPFDEELEVARRDGTRVPVRAIGFAVRDPRGRIVKVQGAMRDVTPTRDDEIADERSMRRLVRMADALPVKVWSSRADGTPEFFNERFVDYTGLSRDTLGTPDGILETLHPDDRERWTSTLATSIATGTEFTAEVRVRRRDGEYRWHVARSVPVCDQDGNIEQWQGSAMDVHDLRELELESRSLRERLATTLDHMSDVFMLLDEEFRITYLNEVGLQHAGEAERVLGSLMWEAYPDVEDTEIAKVYRHTMSTGESARCRYYAAKQDATYDVASYRNDTGVALFFRDVSEEVLLEQRVLRSERLESLGQLTGGVAHDFNNLLTVVMGSAGLLREELGEDHPSLATVELVESAAERGAELTRRLLAFARRQPLEPRAVDMDGLVQDVHELLQHTLGEHIAVDIVSAPELPAALVDPAQFENALINVCLNSRDAMPDGGRLLIEVSARDVDEELATTMEVDVGRYVVVSVTDTGVGIEPDDIPRLFEPFFTTKPLGSGTGLGLPMVYGFIKQSAGHVAVESEPGNGTTVRLFLPAAGSDTVVERGDRETPEVEQGHETVLVVEDDELVRSFACEQLVRLGYTVIEASDGVGAIEILRGDQHLDLLFTDVVLPGGLSGRAVADAAAGARPDLPVLFTSGYTGDAISSRGRIDEGVDLLSKPYPAHELAVRVRRALDRS